MKASSSGEVPRQLHSTSRRPSPNYGTPYPTAQRAWASQLALGTLPGTARPFLLIVVVAQELGHLLRRRLDRSPALALLIRLGEAFHEFGDAAGLGLGQVETIHGLSEPQVGVDTGHHNPGVDRNQLDSEQ